MRLSYSALNYYAYSALAWFFTIFFISQVVLAKFVGKQNIEVRL